MRCLALAKAWQHSGGSVSCLMAESIAGLEKRLGCERVAIKKMTTIPGTLDDAEHTVAEARSGNAAWVVVDGYRFGADYIRKLKSAGLRVLFLDDDGRFDFYAADVVLNQNLSAASAMYERREAFTRLLVGSEYVLLRPEFLGEPQNHEHPAVARRILVTMGGTDSENVTSKVLLALSRVERDFEAKVVIGSGNPWQGELQLLADRMSSNIQLLCSPENMAPLMGWADVAISGAGGTCWELAYLGVPSIVIALSGDQQAIAKGLAERKIAISLGWHAKLSETKISGALNQLLIDQARRLAMSERGRNMVDGQGAARVTTFLQSYL